MERGLKAPVDLFLGIEDFNYPETHALFRAVAGTVDIVHCHNLHTGYFDLRALSEISHKVPTVVTLHDGWLLSGHCAHSFDCARWETGCGHCPDLAIYPEVRRDATAINWRRKARIYANSRLHIATPSQWLMDRVDRSILATAARDARVIQNGIDLSIFCPGDKIRARAKLGLPQENRIILCVAHDVRSNPFKDFATLRRAADLVQAASKLPVVFVALGEDAGTEIIGSTKFLFAPFRPSSLDVAEFYRAADVFVHPAKVDTFPSTVLEALACGTPVVATKVGGIPEQITDGVTGLLVPPAEAEAMAVAIMRLVEDEALCRKLATAGARLVADRFGLDRMVDRYLAWYGDILDGKRESPGVRSPRP